MSGEAERLDVLDRIAAVVRRARAADDPMDAEAALAAIDEALQDLRRDETEPATNALGRADLSSDVPEGP